MMKIEADGPMRSPAIYTYSNDKPFCRLITMQGDRDVRYESKTFHIYGYSQIFNYLYADVVSLMDPANLGEIMRGRVGSIQITQGFLLGAAILMETAIVMVLLSRVLEYALNRWANMIVGSLQTTAVAASLLIPVIGGTTPAFYYLFFATIEIVCTVLIVWYAWRWKPAAALTIGDGSSDA